jgi:hypothetical protein
MIPLPLLKIGDIGTEITKSLVIDQILVSHVKKRNEEY